MARISETCAQGLAAERLAVNLAAECLAVAASADDGLLTVLVLVCVVQAVTWPWLVMAVLTREPWREPRREPRREPLNSEPRREPLNSEPRREPAQAPQAPLTMHAAVSSAIGSRLSASDSALLDSSDTVASPVFARMLANTREAPPTPCRARQSTRRPGIQSI